MDLKQVIASIPDFPKPGILFRDITPVTEDPAAFAHACDRLAELVATVPATRIAAIESRGFVFGGPLALHRGLGLVLVRKAGKLPRTTLAASYALEYGEATLEVHQGSVAPGEKVIVIDDLLATGGTAAATGRLIRQCGADVAAYLFLVELRGLQGRRLLGEAPVLSLVQYD
jgi:adenine phosphoribosyltransferase